MMCANILRMCKVEAGGSLKVLGQLVLQSEILSQKINKIFSYEGFSPTPQRRLNTNDFFCRNRPTHCNAGTTPRPQLKMPAAGQPG